jgi:cation diffusion facilitator family transporter
VPSSDRFRQVSRVLTRVLLLNLLVAAAKIVFGYATGAISIVSDGFHSLTDSASNVVALVGVRVARKPPDNDHPYGHRKFETLAAGAIFVFLVLVMIEVVETSFGRLRHPEPPHVTLASFAVMLLTVAVNLTVVWYEARAGRRLKSELLIADAKHTRSDVLTSLTVIAALAGVAMGFPLLDPIAGIVVAGFIGHTGYQIARDTSRILSDSLVIDEREVEFAVMQVPGVLGCHQIRTRGSADHVFLDLHVWMAADTSLFEAHRLSHVVKDRLMERFPEVVDALIHIEPPPGGPAPGTAAGSASGPA